MDDLLKLLKTYRVTPGLMERLELAEEIFALIEPDLHRFVFGHVRRYAAEDVYQEVAKAVVTSLGSWRGNSIGEFRGWFYRIARNKLNDHFRKQANDRLESSAEIWDLVEADALRVQMSDADRVDLQDALKLLDAAKPECSEYLWQHYVLGFDYAEIAGQRELSYDAVRMKIGRCLEGAKSLIA